MAESHLLSLNSKLFFNVLDKFDYVLIVIVQLDAHSVAIKDELISDLDESLRETDLGCVQILHESNLEFAFTVFLSEFEKGFRLSERVIKEFGVFLNTKIIQETSDYKILREYG